MEKPSKGKSEENTTGDKNDLNTTLSSVSSNSCPNSNVGVINEHETDNSEIRVLTNNIEKSLSINHNSLQNGVAHDCDNDEIEYVSYKSELQMPDIMRLIQKDLSEPYSIYTYRYFIHNWPKLCFLVSFYNAFKKKFSNSEICNNYKPYRSNFYVHFKL